MRNLLLAVLSAVIGTAVALVARSFFAEPAPAQPVPAPASAAPLLPVDANGYTLPVSTPAAVQTKPEPVYCTGVARRNHRFVIELSDGRVVTEEDGAAVEIASRWVKIDGQKYPLRRRIPDTSATLSENRRATHAASTPETAPLQERDLAREEGSWVRGADGVARLRQ